MVTATKTQTKFLTVAEVAQRLNLSLRTSYRLKLPWVKSSERLKRVRESDLEAYIQSRTQTV